MLLDRVCLGAFLTALPFAALWAVTALASRSRARQARHARRFYEGPALDREPAGSARLRATVLGPLLAPLCRLIPAYHITSGPRGSTSWWRNYSRYLVTRRWQARRRLVLMRDGGRCRRCGRRGNQVHHLTYERVGHEHLDDLVLLCGPCHAAADARERTRT